MVHTFLEHFDDDNLVEGNSQLGDLAGLLGQSDRSQFLNKIRLELAKKNITLDFLSSV